MGFLGLIEMIQQQQPHGQEVELQQIGLVILGLQGL